MITYMQRYISVTESVIKVLQKFDKSVTRMRQDCTGVLQKCDSSDDDRGGRQEAHQDGGTEEPGSVPVVLQMCSNSVTQYHTVSQQCNVIVYSSVTVV
jgi:hypothetical protein